MLLLTPFFLLLPPPQAAKEYYVKLSKSVYNKKSPYRWKEERTTPFLEWLSSTLFAGALISPIKNLSLSVRSIFSPSFYFLIILIP